MIDIADHPLASLDEIPLHSGRVDFQVPGWYGCECPERPADDDTLWDWRCRACVLHAKATLRNQGDLRLTWYARSGSEPKLQFLSWHVERAEYWGVA